MRELINFATFATVRLMRAVLAIAESRKIFIQISPSFALETKVFQLSSCHIAVYQFAGKSIIRLNRNSYIAVAIVPN